MAAETEKQEILTMRILITNDDGVEAAQLGSLIKWCKKLGDVTVFVPKFEQSGKSHGFEIKKPSTWLPGWKL